MKKKSVIVQLESRKWNVRKEDRVYKQTNQLLQCLSNKNMTHSLLPSHQPYSVRLFALLF